MNIEDKDLLRSTEVTEIMSTTSASSMSDFKGSDYTSKEYLLNVMNAMSSKNVVPINTYKEIVRFLLSRFNNIVYLNDAHEAIKVSCRYGNPERIIAKINEHDNIVLPLLTISQDSIVEADDRRRNATNIMHSSIWNEDTQRAERVVSFCDRPVSVVYNINIWSKYMEDLDQIASQIRLAFNPAVTLDTNFSKDSQAFLSSEDNNYTFTLADREDRIVRKKLSITVETYLKNPKYRITSTGKIEELNLEITAL